MQDWKKIRTGQKKIGKFPLKRLPMSVYFYWPLCFRREWMCISWDFLAIPCPAYHLMLTFSSFPILFLAVEVRLLLLLLKMPQAGQLLFTCLPPPPLLYGLLSHLFTAMMSLKAVPALSFCLKCSWILPICCRVLWQLDTFQGILKLVFTYIKI